MDNQLLNSLAEKYGTPLYVYDGDVIKQQYSRFKNAFKVEKLQIHYAAKALTNISILKLFQTMGAGLDCVSIEEIKLGLLAGFSPEQMIFTPNGVSFDEYKEAVDIGVKVTIDNIPILEKFGGQLKGAAVFIRLNPHLMGGGNSKISVGHIDSKFGISIHQIPIVLRLIKQYDINVEGIHIHTGSDIIDPSIFERVANLIFGIADEFPTIQSIDFGSGFKIKYSEEDKATDIEKIGEVFSKLFNNYCEKRGYPLTLRFEPGKYMVSESGVFLTQVNIVKQTTACTFAAVNSGFNHLIRPMFYEAYHDIRNISNPEAEEKMYSVVGYICESDTFAQDRIINEVREGDILAFKNAGAYCFSMSSNYNSRLKPAEVLLINGKDYLIRKRETFDDLLLNQRMIEIGELV
jgi:diaminopimelate decarboxylase